MAVIENIKCDKCGRIKEETNHWLASYSAFVESEIRFMPIATIETANLSNYAHFCSQDCAIKTFQQWLEENLETKSESVAPEPKVLSRSDVPSWDELDRQTQNDLMRG